MNVPPLLSYWHLWIAEDGSSRQALCTMSAFELESFGRSAPHWTNQQARSEATVVFTIYPVGWVGEWHQNPAPQWILPISGRWWVQSMDGMRVEMGPGELSLGEDQGCITDRNGRNGHRAGTIGNEPVVLMIVQRHVPPGRGPGHLP